MFNSMDDVKIDKSIWLQLLMAYYQLFCNSTGGFYAITEKSMPHDEFVLAELSKAIHEMQITLRASKDKPVTNHLQKALETAVNSSEVETREIAKSIEQLSSLLTWEYGYENIPDELSEKFAYAEILGPQGPVISDQLMMGLVLLAPACYYPEHFHKDVSESYICISGQCTINGTKINMGDYYYNSPGNVHYISTNEKNPCLLAFAWVDNRETFEKYITEFA